jgi:hypothetical protein
MAASTSPHLAFNGFPSRVAAVEPKYEAGKDAYQSLREMVRTEENRRSWLSYLVRSGVLFVILFRDWSRIGARYCVMGSACHDLPFRDLQCCSWCGVSLHHLDGMVPL